MKECVDFFLNPPGYFWPACDLETKKNKNGTQFLKIDNFINFAAKCIGV